MCFSQTVSFVGGGILIAGGAFSSVRALQTNIRYLPAALMPVLAGIQQGLEGHVWMGLNRGDVPMVSWAALGFIFFSFFLWPIWIPYLTWFLEPDEKKRKLFRRFAYVGAVLGLILFVPQVLHPEWLTVEIARNSIAYSDRLLTDFVMPREAAYLIYLLIVTLPPLLSSYVHMRLFGLTLLVIITTTYFFLTYAYISFFCFLAAAGTLHLIYIIIFDKCCQKHCPVLFR